MPFRHFALILAAVLLAGGLSAALIAALPGHGLAVLIPLALIGALLLHRLPRR